MNRATRLRAAILTLAMVLPLGLGACGSGGSPTATASPSSTSAPSTGGAPEVRSLLDKASATVLEQPVIYPDGPTQITSSVLTFAPGATTTQHRHDAPMYVYVMEGTITVHYDGGVVKEYSAGSAFLEALGTVHRGENATDSVTKLLVVNIGAEGVANTTNL